VEKIGNLAKINIATLLYFVIDNCIESINLDNTAK